jgi:carbon monoxide dehydrogenase subunit G
MIETSVSVALEQPVEQAFAFFTDFANEPSWNPECLSVEQTSPGALGVGTTYVSRMKGVSRIDSEIVSMDPPRHVSSRDRSRMGESSMDLRFHPANAGSEVEVTMRLQPRGPFRLLTPLMRVMAKKMASDLPTHMQQGINASVNNFARQNKDLH